MKNRMAALICVLALLLSLAGCGQAGNGSTPSWEKPSSSTI